MLLKQCHYEANHACMADGGGRGGWGELCGSNGGVKEIWVCPMGDDKNHGISFP